MEKRKVIKMLYAIFVKITFSLYDDGHYWLILDAIMKHLYKIIFLFILIISVNNLNAKSNDPHFGIDKIIVKNDLNNLALPTASIATNATAVCNNGIQPVITFTGSGGAAPYIFTYKINDGTDIISAQSTGDILTLNVPTTSVGNFVYTLVSIKDSTNPIQSQTGSVTVKVNALPTVDFTWDNDNTCSGTAIQFNSTIVGSGTYTYAWDFGDGFTSTSQNPNHSFISLGCGTASFPVKLTVTDTNGGCSISNSHTVTVKQKPDIDFEDVNATGASNQFSNCQAASSSNQVYSIKVGNISNSVCISSYSVDWGDGTSNNNITFPITHIYNQLGAYNMIISGLGTNGCINTKNYTIKNVSNPSGGIASPGSTQNLCTPTAPIQFAISNWANNSPGTTYSVNFGDNSAIENFTQAQLESSAYYNAATPASSSNYPIPHSYTTTSCPSSEFIVKLTVTNACGFTIGTIANISTISKPVSNFTAPTSACITSNVLFTNTTVSGFDGGCDRSTKFSWNFGDPSGVGNIINTGFTTAVSNVNHTFSAPGTYTVTLVTQNSCGISTKTQAICIESPLVSQFTVGTNSGCAPLSVTTTNTTIVTNTCVTPTYLWNVTYTNLNCDVVSANPTYTNGTNFNSASPSFNFTAPGTYTLKLTTTNSCGSTSATQTITVKKPPTAIINPIPNACGTATISPTAVVTGCAPVSSVLTYAWSFPGGSPASSIAANPGTISYGASGTYTVSLIVTNECGVSAAAEQVFIVNDLPTLTNTPLTQTICSGSPSTLVNLTSNLTGATFSWTASASGITGYTSSGTNTIPVQTLINSGTTSGTITYTVTPKLGTCNGATTNYVINVIPAPQITAQPLSSSVCKDGTPTTLTFTLSGVTGTPNYQWYSNSSAANTGGSLVPGEINAAFLPPATTVGTFYYYCIVSLSSGGCPSIKTNTATVVITPLVTIATQPTSTQNLCVGATISSPLMVTHSGGTGTVSYQWYSNTTNSVVGATQISGAVSASYTPGLFAVSGTMYYYVTVSSNGNGCDPVTSNLAEIIVFSDPTVSSPPLPTQTLCQGAVSQSLQVIATGGNGSFSYQWYRNMANNNTSGTAISGAVSDVYTPSTLAVGTLYYYCLITQSTLSCDVKSTLAAVIVNAAPTITNQPVSSTICLGGVPTLLAVTYANGVGTPTYQWYSNNTNLNLGGLSISGAINATFSPSDSTVGTTFYYCIITLPALGGCSSITSNTANVSINAFPIIDVQPELTQNVCKGGTIANPLSVSYSGGAGSATYQWFSNSMNSNSGGITIAGATNASYTPPVFNTVGNFYYYCQVSLSGNGCGSLFNDAFEISVVEDPIVSNQPLGSQTLCQNAVSSDLIVSVTGGIGTYSYQWYSNGNNSNSGGVLITNATNAIYTPSTASVGTIYYYCVISQSGIGCAVVSTTSTVIINSAPTFTKQPKPSIICLGNVPNLLEVAFINGAGIPQYQWFSNTVNAISGGTIIGGATGASYNPPAANSGTLYYYCVVTLSSGGCSSIISNIAEVKINQNPVIANKSAIIICSGTAFTVAPNNLSGDIVPIGTTYTWTAPVISPSSSINGAAIQTLPQTAISQNLTNTTTSVATVTYTVTPVSGVCIGTNFSVAITVNPAISANITLINSTCFGSNSGSIQTNITGGIPFSSGPLYTISCTGPGGFSSTATSISNLSPGIYDLTIQDAGGCPFSKSYTITEPQDIVINRDIEKNISCFGAADGRISISVTGGTGVYSYSWTKDGTPFTALDRLTNLAPGKYQVTVNDTKSCGPKTASFTITEPLVLDLSLINQTNVLCYGALTGAINVGVIGGTPSASGYTFAWKGPSGFTSISQNLSSISAGAYNLTVTDASGCTDTLPVIITQPTAVIIDVTTTPIICYGGNNASINLSISGGIGPYQTVWNTLATGTFQDNLSAGNYQITVTDANNCSKIVDVNIPEAPIFTINPIVKQISCFGANNGSINLNLIGGVVPIKLVWSDGSTSGLTRNNLGPGTYTVTITDSKPCVITRTFLIQEPQLLVLGATVTNAFECTNANSGAINLLVAGGTSPFTYSWTNGATTEDLTTIPAGNYMVTVIDASGCSKTAQYIITRPKPIAIAVTTETLFDCDAKSVSQKFTALASGGVPPFTYNWSSGTISGANNTIMETDESGLVVLVVADALGCKANYSLNVAVPVIGNTSFSTSSYSHTAFGTFSISDPIQFTNTATGDYSSMAWDFGDGSVAVEENPLHSYAKEGSYVVTQTVTYPFGCIYTYTVTLVTDKGYKLIVPNGFTPNGDGINETFKPVFLGFKSLRLDVYDTWGELIFSEIGETLHGWDGKVKEKESENGNYYYKVKGTTFYGTIINGNGPFTIIR
jgi:gliding motility-associated-like protein